MSIELSFVKHTAFEAEEPSRPTKGSLGKHHSHPESSRAYTCRGLFFPFDIDLANIFCLSYMLISLSSDCGEILLKLLLNTAVP